MIEMLLQSQNGELHILPALPEGLGAGQRQPASARAATSTVDIAWDSCGAARIVVAAGRDGNVTVRSTLFEQPYDVAFDKGAKPKSLATSGRTFTFAARGGATYTFTRSGAVGCAS